MSPLPLSTCVEHPDLAEDCRERVLVVLAHLPDEALDRAPERDHQVRDGEVHQVVVHCGPAVIISNHHPMFSTAPYLMDLLSTTERITNTLPTSATSTIVTTLSTFSDLEKEIDLQNASDKIIKLLHLRIFNNRLRKL